MAKKQCTGSEVTNITPGKRVEMTNQEENEAMDRESSIRFRAAVGRMVAPSEKERAVDRLLLRLPLDDEEVGRG